MHWYLTKARDPISSLTHLYGAIFSGVAIILLLMKTIFWSSPTLDNILAVTLFGISLLALYTASTVYHFSRGTERRILILRKLDHAMIYVLIAGTYTPILLSYLAVPQSYIFTAIMWICALGGISLKLLWFGAPRWLQTALYLGMGWAIVFDLPALKAIPAGGIGLLLAGGICYTIGGVIYMLKKPNFSQKFGFHELFHVFVLLGSIFHFLMIFIYVA